MKQPRWLTKETLSHIFEHSEQQQKALSYIYAYLADLNALHSQLKIEKEREEAANHAHNTLDAIFQYQQHLQNWKLGNAFWKFDCPLVQVVAQACPAGASTAFLVWSFFKEIHWHPPDLPALDDDWGITWYELAIGFMLYTGVALPVWIYSKTDRLPTPYAFNSPKVDIQKDDAKSLWNQANTLRPVVRYLDNTLPMPLIPNFIKSGASSLVRLGFHKSLVGGIAKRPVIPNAEKLLLVLRDYSSLPAQSYPHHVRLPMPLVHKDEILQSPYADIPFKFRSGLYQRIKKCIRNHQSLEHLSYETWVAYQIHN